MISEYCEPGFSVLERMVTDKQGGARVSQVVLDYSWKHHKELLFGQTDKEVR